MQKVRADYAVFLLFKWHMIFTRDQNGNMKHAAIAAIIISSIFSYCTPKPQDTNTCFKGILVKRGACGQRVIRLSDSDKKGLMIARHWRDSLSGRDYENVFTVANPCDFPSSIQQDEEISFNITHTPGITCIQCYAYTPVPAESNRIIVGCINAR